MTTPTPLPEYIYKILPLSPSPTDPLPLNLPLSALDSRDGFLHMSTSSQILGTLNAFFGNDEGVWILRVPYKGVEKYIKWEDSKGKQPDEKGGCWDVEGKKGYFPHIHANGPDGGLKLGKDEVDVVAKWVKGKQSWGPKGWPFEEDVPKE